MEQPEPLLYGALGGWSLTIAAEVASTLQCAADGALAVAVLLVVVISACSGNNRGSWKLEAGREAGGVTQWSVHAAASSVLVPCC